MFHPAPRDVRITVLLLIFAGGLFALSRFLSDEMLPAEEDAGVKIDYSLLNAEITAYSETGFPVYRLSTAHAAHYPAEQQTQLRNITINYQPVNDSGWQLEAKSGTVPDDRSMIQLADAVTIRFQDHLYPGTIRTEKLLIDPQAHTAFTDVPVSIDQKPNQLVAGGLRGNLQESRVELLSGVKGRYEP